MYKENGKKQMTSSTDHRPDAFFVGEHLAMDFLNSIAMPSGEQIEWLLNGVDLVNWLLHAGVIDDSIAKRFRSGNTRSLDNVATEARLLREWLRNFAKRHAGKPLPQDILKELEPLNQLLARDGIYFQIGASDGNAPSMQAIRRWEKPEELLLPIAEAIGDLVCHADFNLIRICENDACTLMFYDRTKSHARRWCSMAVCGNRAKAAAHRARIRDKGTKND
jgi:predicted RNA-binding Zn ribbon-like protein